MNVNESSKPQGLSERQKLHEVNSFDIIYINGSLIKNVMLEGTYLKIIKDIYKRHRANIIVNIEEL